MSIDEIIEFVNGLGGVLTLRPVSGDGSPDISWGDIFFYYSPDGVVPSATQPFATIVTKDYPEDALSQLDRPDTFRLNVVARKGAAVDGVDPSTVDSLFAHPVYGRMGWVSVVNPGPRTDAAVRELLVGAHDRARARHKQIT